MVVLSERALSMSAIESHQSDQEFESQNSRSGVLQLVSLTAPLTASGPSWTNAEAALYELSKENLQGSQARFDSFFHACFTYADIAHNFRGNYHSP